MRTAGIVSLGCPRNEVDSEIWLGILKKKGFLIQDPSKAEIIFINTCSFIQDAKKQSIETIEHFSALKRKGKIAKLIICGCFVRHHGKKLLRYFPEVDALLDAPASWGKIERPIRIAPPHMAYLRIAEGCLQQCSYCVIPKIRGPLQSRRASDILEEVSQLQDKGVRELVLVAQDTTAWGKDFRSPENLAWLLRQISRAAKKITWIRLLYTYPQFITQTLIEAVASLENVCHYIDMPLQHVNKRILTLMGRGSSREQFLKLIGMMRKKIPDISLRSSFIVGFPTETETEFQELLSFLSEVHFKNAGAFIYSREEGTKAYTFPQIHHTIKKERFRRFMELQQKISLENNRRFVGTQANVLVDSVEHGISFARSYADAYEIDGNVLVRQELKPGNFYKVQISAAFEYDLEGTIMQRRPQ